MVRVPEIGAYQFTNQAYHSTVFSWRVPFPVRAQAYKNLRVHAPGQLSRMCNGAPKSVGSVNSL